MMPKTMPRSAHPKTTRKGLPGPTVAALRPYQGKWVAFLGPRILAGGKDLTKVLAVARRKAHGRVPELMEVPPAAVVLL